MISTGQHILQRFSNIGHIGPSRRYPGFEQTAQTRCHQLEPRKASHFVLSAGDLLSITSGSEGTHFTVVIYDVQGTPAFEKLGVSSTASVAMADFSSHALAGWIAAKGSAVEAALPCADLATGDDPVVLRANGQCDVWIIRPVSSTDLTYGFSGGVLQVAHQSATPGFAQLPDPLGEVREEFTVSRASAMSYAVRAGEVVQIIDVEGQQCSDFQAFRRDAVDQGKELFIDGTATRSMTRRAFPGPGLFDKFYDQSMTPLMRVVQDTCGRHDTFGLACTARGYEERGFPGHVNCSDNISAALAPFDIVERRAWPAINFFWNTWIDPHQHLRTEESFSRAGDYVALEALEDLICVSTACPDDIDPINGWNPTDVHVRIYKPETRIQRAVAYRPKEDAPMSISQESAFHPRIAPLTDHFAPTRDLWTAASYPSHGVLGEYWACREAVTLQDMSGLRKFDIIGPDAARLLQQVMTRDLDKLPVWRGSYMLMCDESGEVIDDGTLFRLSDDLFRWCCGSEESGRWLQTHAQKLGLQVRLHDLAGSLPNLALQGPKSRDLLRNVVFTQPHVPALDQMKWFGATVGRLKDRDGVPFLLTRSGYTGELGYELFCAKSDALTLWDALSAAGEAYGLVPMGSAALDVIRIEAGLAAAGAEFAPGVDAFEAGLGFAVDLKKDDFIGRAALARNAQTPRRQLRGLKLACDDVPAAGLPVFSGERQIGEITSATRSPMLKCAIAMARLNVEHAESGTAVEIGQLDGRMKRLAATVCDVPFVDPKRERARA